MSSSYRAVGSPQSSPSAGSSQPEILYEEGFASPKHSNLRTGILQGRAPRPGFNVKSLFSRAMALHLGVLAFYVTLCIIWALDIQQNWTIHTNRIKLFNNINIINHVIMLAFTVAIVAVMQEIATHSAFNNLPQPLTTLADKMAAWNGLGSSLINLFHNLSYRATLADVILITAYFATLSGLGLSSSYVFNVYPVADTPQVHNKTTWPGGVSLDTLLPPGISGTPSNFSDIRFDWYKSSLALDSVYFVDEYTLAGIDPVRNRVFDTLNNTLRVNHTGYAWVDYTEFHVKCGSVPHVSLSATALPTGGDDLLPTLLSINYTLGSQSMILSDYMFVSPSNSSSAISGLWQPSNVLIRVPGSPLIPGIGRNVVLYNIYNETGAVSGSRPILDDNGYTGSSWPLTVRGPDGSTLLTTGLMVQVIGCSLNTTLGLDQLDAATNQLLDSEYPTSDRADVDVRNWTDWRPDLTSSIDPEDMWASMFLPDNSASLWRDQPIPLDPMQWSCIGENLTLSELQSRYQSCHIPTIIEDFLTTLVFGNAEDRSIGDVHLGDLEFALAAATTMMIWSAAANDGTLTTYTTKEPFSSRTVRTLPGTVTVTDSRLVGLVDFNEPLLFLGTALAVLLTALGVYILGMTDVDVERAPVDDVKLLSLMTLDNSAVASRLSGWKTDQTQEKRMAGKFLVKIVGHKLVPAEPAGHETEGIRQGLISKFKEVEEKNLGQ